MRSPVRMAGAMRRRTAVITLVGAAAALVGAGTASAATLVPTSGAHPAAPAHASHAAHAPAAVHPAGAVHAAGSVRAVGVPLSQPRTSAAHHAAATPATAAPAPAPAPAPAAPTWGQIEQQVARQTSPSEPAAANALTPAGTSGPQAWMAISGSQQANATTIVQQALAKGMGIRSAVIAVATSMQESQLQNINYGTGDSVGLFQQQPSSGWGTAQQIMNPQYAADAFLTALQQHQASDPGWATQPLWANAQAVQNSGFPFAYAKWEAQAAQLVQQIVTQVK